MDSKNKPRVRVITIAVGGATCSGKTTLAKHLRTCLYDSFIIHQDDFAPPQELVPVHPQYGVQDWDDAPGAIQWSRLASFLGEIKRTGILPESHYSHDHLNENKVVPIEDDILSRWRIESEKFARDHLEKYGEKIVWSIIDGFLMYWDERVISNLDVRVFLRVPQAVLKERREERHGYHTAVQSDPEGSLWRDPPHYFEQIVYPAYFRAHQDLFEGGDVENGKLTGKVEGLILFEGMEMDVKEMVNRTMKTVLEVSAAQK